MNSIYHYSQSLTIKKVNITLKCNILSKNISCKRTLLLLIDSIDSDSIDYFNIECASCSLKHR